MLLQGLLFLPHFHTPFLYFNYNTQCVYYQHVL
nr:MAG TPA: hypothetical protein [Caudoviricetes sp.]